MNPKHENLAAFQMLYKGQIDQKVNNKNCRILNYSQ